MTLLVNNLYRVQASALPPIPMHLDGAAGTGAKRIQRMCPFDHDSRDGGREDMAQRFVAAARVLTIGYQRVSSVSVPGSLPGIE